MIDAALAKGDIEILRKDNPFYHLHWCGNEDFNRYATIGIAPLNPERVAFRRSQPHTWSDKIRIGYMSSDFWDRHATMKLLQRILELHDKDRFEVTLFCHTGPEFLKHNDDRPQPLGQDRHHSRLLRSGDAGSGARA